MDDMHAPTMLRRTEGLVRQTQRIVNRTPCLAAAQQAFTQWSTVRRVLTGAGAIVPLGGPASRSAPSVPSLAPRAHRPEDENRSEWPGDATAPPARPAQPAGSIVPLRPTAASTPPIESGTTADTGSKMASAPQPPADLGRPPTPARGGKPARSTPIQVRLNAAPVVPPGDAPAPSESPAAAAGTRAGRARPADGPVVRVVAKQAESADVPGATDALARAVARSRPTSEPPIESETPGRPGEPATRGRGPSVGTTVGRRPVDAPPTVEPPSGGELRPTGLVLRGSTARRGRTSHAMALSPQVRTHPGVEASQFRPPVPAEPSQAEFLELSPSHSAAPELHTEAPYPQPDRAAWETGEDDLHRLGEQLERLLRDEARRHGVIY